VSSRARFVWAVGVGGELSEDRIGQASFQAAQGFHRGLAGGEFPPVVGAAFGVVADLDDRHDVQDPVQAPVPGSGQVVPLLLTGGRVDRGGAGPRREVSLRAEPGDVADVAEDPGGADRADAVEVGQAGGGRGDRGAQLLLAVLQLPVEPDHVGE
jgi:hypothetical protein